LSRLTQYGVLAACTCRLFITIDPDTDTFAWSATLRLAERCGLTLYDAAYLELAHVLSFPWPRSIRNCALLELNSASPYWEADL
jgi:hypothetical protein